MVVRDDAGALFEEADIVHDPLGVFHLGAAAHDVGAVRSRFTKLWSKTAFMGLTADSGSFNWSSSAVSKTPALTAAS